MVSGNVNDIEWVNGIKLVPNRIFTHKKLNIPFISLYSTFWAIYFTVKIFFNKIIFIVIVTMKISF